MKTKRNMKIRKTMKTKEQRKTYKAVVRIIRTLKKKPEWRARLKHILEETIKELRKNKGMPHAKRYIRNMKAMLAVIRVMDKESN
jgi:hypothetical protein